MGHLLKKVSVSRKFSVLPPILEGVMRATEPWNGFARSYARSAVLVGGIPNRRGDADKFAFGMNEQFIGEAPY